MLAMFDSAKPIHLHTDWSARTIGGYISQLDDNDVEQPIAYFSCKCKLEESKYHPYMGEILIFVDCLRHFRNYIHIAIHVNDSKSSTAFCMASCSLTTSL
ncbi:hypothetical protein HDU98_000838, partial [Podochytrium sp. JEL0797]